MIEINVLSWYTETISTEKTGNVPVSRRKVVQMTEHNATSLSASLVNRKVYTVCYTGLDTLSSFHDALYEATISDPAKPYISAPAAFSMDFPARCTASSPAAL